MKLFAGKSSKIIVATVLLLVLVGATFAFAAVIDNITPDNEGVQNIMKSITGEDELSPGAAVMADFNSDGEINVLDVIALKSFIEAAKDYNDGYTVGIY